MVLFHIRYDLNSLFCIKLSFVGFFYCAKVTVLPSRKTIWLFKKCSMPWHMRVEGVRKTIILCECRRYQFDHQDQSVVLLCFATNTYLSGRKSVFFGREDLSSCVSTFLSAWAVLILFLLVSTVRKTVHTCDYVNPNYSEVSLIYEKKHPDLAQISIDI